MMNSVVNSMVYTCLKEQNVCRFPRPRDREPVRLCLKLRVRRHTCRSGFREAVFMSQDIPQDIKETMHFKHFTEPGDEIGKIFIGGLSWETTHETLLQYFGQFGELVDCVVMKNPQTGLSRGFGFVKYKDAAVAEMVLAAGPHILDGRQIDPKICNPRHLNQGGKNAASYGKKIFLGGLPAEATEADLTEVFSQYGAVCDVVIMYDQQKQKSRGFGFLTFESEETVDKVCSERFVSVCGRQVECKKAEPRDSQALATKTQPSVLSPPTSPVTKMGPPAWMVAGGVVNTNQLAGLSAVQLQKEPYHIPTVVNGELNEQGLMSGGVPGLTMENYSGSLHGNAMLPGLTTVASNLGAMTLQHSYASGGLAANSPIHCCGSGASGPMHDGHEAIAAADCHGVNSQSMGLLGGMVPLLIMAPEAGANIGGAANQLSNNLLQNAMLGSQLAANGAYIPGSNAFMRMAPVMPAYHPYRRAGNRLFSC